MKLFKKTTAITASVLIAGQISLFNTEALGYKKEMTHIPYVDAYEDIISGADYTIMVRLSGKYLTAEANGNVCQWEKLSDETQEWKIIILDSGMCKIVSAHNPKLSLTVENGDSTNGNNISLQEYKNLPSQHFILHRTDDAYYITAECSGNAAFDIYDISYENGANLDQWDYWGGEGQKFYIRPVDNKYTLIKGDINGDTELDVFDRILMQKGITASFDAVTYNIADINNNSLVDESDISTFTDYILSIEAKTDSYVDIEYNKPDTAYLFAYFLGNAPEQEQLSYAISYDGYNFKALNNGKSVWKSSVGTECIRDPYIFKGEDGLYHLLATDMKSSLGWSSNRNIISAISTDLVHWFDETLIEIANKYPLMQGADRAWAPQAIYDPKRESYMIYFAARVPGRDNRTIMYYAYSKDLKKLDTEPQLLFAPKNGDDAIDSDIIYQNGKFYMYYKNETNKKLYLATSENANGPYNEIKQISADGLGVEGPNIYNIIGTNEWIMMSDAYGDGYYVMQKTNDLTNFTDVNRNNYSFDFTPRHGYVIPINSDQYTALTNAFPSDSIKKFNTDVKEVIVRTEKGKTPVMPDMVTAEYSDGSTAEFPVSWSMSDINNIDINKSGEYRIKGTLQSSAELYDNPFISERADPYIVDGGDGYYYFTASYPAYGSVDKGYDRIILRRSNTVAGLATAQEKTIWTAHTSGILAKHIWAPEMHKINGVWYMFFAAGRSDDIWAIRPYVLKCDGDPYTGNWTECGQMQAAYGDTESFRSFSLDMTCFEHNGKHYVIWAEIKGDSSLFMAEINPDEPYKLISQPILLTKPEYNWELVNNRVNEGAAVLKTDKKVYVFFSASGTGSEYCVGRLEADVDADLMKQENWKKLTSPVLSSSDMNGEAGPGHNSFVVDENGNTLIVYHARPASHSSKSCGTYNSDPLYDPCRHTRIRRVLFDQNGVPDISMSSSAEISANNKEITAVVIVKE